MNEPTLWFPDVERLKELKAEMYTLLVKIDTTADELNALAREFEKIGAIFIPKALRDRAERLPQ